MKITTFGEIMLRLKPHGTERLMQSPCLEATFGGGEANVAVSLANFGMDSAFVTEGAFHFRGVQTAKGVQSERLGTLTKRNFSFVFES